MLTDLSLHGCIDLTDDGLSALSGTSTLVSVDLTKCSKITGVGTMSHTYFTWTQKKKKYSLKKAEDVALGLGLGLPV